LLKEIRENKATDLTVDDQMGLKKILKDSLNFDQALEINWKPKEPFIKLWKCIA